MPEPISTGGRISVPCPCGASFTVEMKFAGRQGKCPKCGNLMLVPTPTPKVTCPRCNYLNPVEEKYCLQCGEPLEAPAPAPAPNPGTRRMSRPPDALPPSEARRPSEAPAVAPGTRRVTRPPAAPPPQEPAASGTRRVTRPPAPPPAEPNEAPAEAPAARRTGALRSKLAELEKPRRSVILRFIVFLVLAGGAGTGTFYGTRQYAMPRIAAAQAAETEARKSVWPPKSLDTLHDRLQEISRSKPREIATAPATPEEKALHATIESELARLKLENQEAVKVAEAAHKETEKWQLGWYGVIGLAGLLAGLIGWKLSA